MGHIRLVEDVAVVEWSPLHLPDLVAELKTHLDEHQGRRVLVNLARADLRADELETLSQAASICRERNAPLAGYGASDDLQRLVEVLHIGGELPPLLACGEAEAVGAIRRDGHNVGAAPAAPVPTPAPVPAPIPAPALVGAELVDLGTAVTERFDPISDALDDVGPPSGAVTGARAKAEQGADDLLAINWTDLASTGYQIGGPGGERLSAEAARGTPTPRRAPKPDDDVIDLDDPAPGQRKKPAQPARPFQKTEILPAFKVEEGTRDSGEWSARPAAAFAAPEDGGDDYSPLDQGSAAPPSFLAQQQQAPTPPPQKRASPPTRPVAGRRPAPAQPPPAQPPAPQPAQPAGVNPYYDDDGDEQTVMFQATVPVPVEPAPQAPVPSGMFTDSDDQMVMFQPAAQDLALLAQVAQQAAADEAPPAYVEEAAEEEELSQDETIMFQPGALDAALLAEVAAAAGPETHIPPPPVAEPPEPEVPALHLPDGREVELRLFMHDYAIGSELHLSLLDRFLRAGDETVVPQDLPMNGDREAVLGVVDQFVHSRLLRRTRSPRARGGTGFVFAPSPQVRGLAVRLVKLWQTSGSRPKVTAWLAEENQ